MKNNQFSAHDPIATRMASLQQAIGVASDMWRVTNGAPVTCHPSPVTLIAASKTQPEAAIKAAITAGVMAFGENRVQEAQAKWPALKAAYPAVRLHLIGPLQTNKVSDAVALFDVIETLDRPKLVDALTAEEAATGQKREYFIQVNIGEEPQKSGVAPQDLASLLAYARDTLHITGLMAVPPADANPAPYFALLAKLAARYKLPNLSMGMSQDFETAIRLGATHIRIGTALFGERV